MSTSGESKFEFGNTWGESFLNINNRVAAEKLLENKVLIEYLKNLHSKTSSAKEKESATKEIDLFRILWKTNDETDTLLAFKTTDEVGKYVRAFLNNNDVSKKIGRNLSGKNSTDLDFLSVEYDSINRKLETINNGAAVLGAATVFTGCIPLIAGMLIFASVMRYSTSLVGQYEKYKELNYISSACLGFTMGLMKNIAEMTVFYSVLGKIKEAASSDVDIKNRINEGNLNEIQQSQLWGVIQDNLWKFLIFLISQIEFSIDTLGEKQYMFWNAFLSKVTFDPTNTDTTYTYKYTKSYCSKENPQVKKENNPICNNYNDLLMRLLDQKMEDLLWSINENPTKTTILKNPIQTGRRLLGKTATVIKTPISSVSKGFGSVAKGLSNTIGLRIRHENVKGKVDKLKQNLSTYKTKLKEEFEKNYEGKSSLPFALAGIEGFFKTLERFVDEKYGNPKTPESDPKRDPAAAAAAPTTTPAASTVTLGGKFRKTKKTKKMNRRTKKIHDESGTKLRQLGGGGWLDWLRSRNAYQVYREMLREYTITTANVALATTDYTLHYNKCILFLGSDIYKTFYLKYINKEVLVPSEINSLKNEINVLNERQKQTETSIAELTKGKTITIASFIEVFKVEVDDTQNTVDRETSAVGDNAGAGAGDETDDETDDESQGKD